MPIIRLRPDGTTSNDIPAGGIVPSGSTAHAVLRDNDLSSYLKTQNGAAGTLTVLTLDTYTLNPGERVIYVKLGMHVSQTHVWGALLLFSSLSGVGAGHFGPVPDIDLNTPTPPVTISEPQFVDPTDGNEWTQADLNALSIAIAWANPGGTFHAIVHKAWVDVYVKPQPVSVNVAPGFGSIINTATPEFRWVVPRVDGDAYTQMKYELKIWTQAVAEGVGFDPDTSTPIASIPVINYSHPHSHPFNYPEQWPNNPLPYGQKFYWAVKTGVHFPADNTIWWTEWSNLTPFSTNSGPEAIVTLPTGTITTNLPRVEWIYADDQADQVIAYEVRVYARPGASWVGFNPDTTPNAPVFTTGIVEQSNVFNIPVTTPLADNTNFRAYVRVAQKADFGTFSHNVFTSKPGLLWGPWDFNDFLTDFVEPNAPALAIATFEGYIRLDVTPGTEPVVDIDYYVIERSLDNGVTWNTFRYGSLVETDQLDDVTVPFSVHDFEPPYYTNVKYRAYSVSTDLGIPLASQMSNIVQGSIASKNIWIKDPGNFANNAHFPYQDEYLVRTTKRLATVYNPLGRQDAIVVKQQTNYESFTLNLLVMGQELAQKLEAMIASGRTLYVCTPVGCWYMDITGDVTAQDRLGDRRQDQEQVRKYSVPFTEVADVSGN